MYSTTAYSFTTNVLLNKKASWPYSESDLNLIYRTIKNNYPDSIRNHLLTYHLAFIFKNPKLICNSLDSLFTDFKSICRNKLYTHYLDSMKVVRKQLVIKKYTLKEAMESQIADSKDQILTIKQLFKTKPVLIICWARWCAPCIKEIPSEKKLQGVYGDKIDFIYVSIDKSKKPWLDKLNTLAIKDDNNYLVKDPSTSNFMQYYEIVTIPRYLLFDKNGNKVETKELRPSNDGFKSLLDKLIF